MNLLRKILFTALVSIAVVGVANAGPVNVNIFLGQYDETGSGFIFSGSPSSTETWTTIDSDNPLHPGYNNWMPSNVFSADITETLNVPTAATYNFTLTSDDGSYAFVDGVLLGNDGGVHPPSTVTFTDALTAGSHSIEVQFGNLECCGSGVVLTSSVPEPGTYALLLAGLGLLGTIALRRRA